ncbi:outer membrane protein [Thalassospira sp. MBR-102]|jgi:outer membrane scaffolding protein for murein synthesis (MipA/OmpV family)|uniref:Outer membrane protein n=2 Tax=Thalassospira TaxID=168934 RepID=A0AB72UG49_9PROT|nr:MULTISPECIES: MipA/OmpV family protein [Thalassospira]AJD53092.1 putative outer membrane protein [Thalassospira xiamenensis M-5 = DSM 17429]KEO54774.1 structural protein MipA [Thalassospira permensis NBRC 106175]RCK39247.1 structural protein MipA [Thalassospira xiamenensis]SIT28843.1 Outer membrane scaffolding protein for murein synthesis, MipA/OmpV family [Thalassospira xiamenensis M-5 = DSM 17429]
MNFYKVSNLVGNGLILLGAGLCASALMLVISTSANAQQGTRDVLREEVNPKQDEAADPWLGGVWQFGAYGQVESNPYRGADSVDLDPLPLLAYDADRLHIGTDGISVTAWQNEFASLDVLGALRMKPFENGDSEYLRGMKERDMAYEAGIGFTSRLWRGEVGAYYLTDLNDAHDGHELDLTYTIPMDLQNVTFDWGGGVRWQSDKLANYHVGVSGTEVRSDRAVYDADAAFIPHLDVSVTYPITESIVLLGTGGVELLPDSYTDSPLIDDDYVYSIGLGLVYNF